MKVLTILFKYKQLEVDLKFEEIEKFYSCIV